ncbi:MAG: PAS domain S-box protein [Desulfobacteraceae bacterium]|nr:MAG: PAS domain S-box protein [Desulfobacteraceae bacterium]
MAQSKKIANAGETAFCNGDMGYRDIVEHINEGVVIIKDGRIVFANRAFYEICRKNPETVLGSEFSELIASSDRKAVSKFLAQRTMSDGLPDRIDFTMQRPEEDGIMEMKVNIIQCAGSAAVLGAITDITERRKTRLELLRMKERLESILHSMNDVVVSFSPSDSSILAINPSAEALYGVPVRDFRSGKRHIMDFVLPGDSEKVKHFYASIPELEFAELSYGIISNNRAVKWVLDEGRLVYGEKGRVRRIDHVIRDITEEKLALDALKLSEEKYRSFFESTNDMAYAVTPEGTFMDINDAGLKLLGFKTREEALGSNIKETWVDPSEREELLAELREKGYVAGKRARLKDRSEKVIEVAITARAKINGAGDILHYEGLIHNITKTMEDQRNRVLRNAAGGMCHYLNSHLATLLFSQECVEEDIKALAKLLQPLEDKGPTDSTSKQIQEALASLRDSFHGVGYAYKKIAQVTNAFNSAFLTYKEESYLDRTILDIFQSVIAKDPPG